MNVVTVHDTCPSTGARTIGRVGKYDVAVVGAGPAGSTASRLLASWGHRVILLQRPETPASTLAESIPPSCRKLFAACGILDSIDAAGFIRSTGNTVWWGSSQPREERFAEGALGYQVERGTFDDLLRGAAAASGAELRENAVRDISKGTSSVRVHCGSDEIEARFLLDCSGRSGIVARRGWRAEPPGQPRTVALVAVWTSATGWGRIDPTHTLIESYDDGWAWSVPAPRCRRYVTCMVDPQRTRLARGAPAEEIYRLELAKASHLQALLQDSRLERGPWGCDASVYAAKTYAADRILLVGDAASFIDPLSSCGVKKAIASAWLAAVAVHTSLLTPAMTDAALRLFASREEEMASSMLRQSRPFFEDATVAHTSPFWSDRAGGVDLPSATEPDVRAFREDPRVQSAFAWLKAQPGIALRAAGGLRKEPHAVVRGHEIVMEERLVADACPAGLRFVRDVDLAGVLTLAPNHDQVGTLFEAYNRRFPPVALPDFLGALSLMIAFGLLEDSRASAG